MPEGSNTEKGQVVVVVVVVVVLIPFISLAIKTFAVEGRDAAMDITGDDADAIRKQKKLVKWYGDYLGFSSRYLIFMI